MQKRPAQPVAVSGLRQRARKLFISPLREPPEVSPATYTPASSALDCRSLCFPFDRPFVSPSVRFVNNNASVLPGSLKMGI